MTSRTAAGRSKDSRLTERPAEIRFSSGVIIQFILIIIFYFLSNECFALGYQNKKYKYILVKGDGYFFNTISIM